MKIGKWHIKTTKQIVAMNENEEITFRSISEAGRNLNIPRNTIQHYLKMVSIILLVINLNIVVKIPCRVSIKYV